MAVPSAPTPSQSSQIVVAPTSVMWSHDGSVVLEQQLVGHVEVAGVGQDGQQERRGEEAGAEVGAGGAHQGDEIGRRLGAQVVGHEPEGERPHEVGLGLGLDVAVGVEELGAPGVEHVRRPAAVVRRGVGVARGSSAMRASCVGGAVQVGGGDRAVVVDEELGEDGVHVDAGLEPLAEVPAAVPQVALVGQGLGAALDP